MQIIRDLPEAEAIADPEIRQLALQRIAEISEQGFSLSEVGEIWIAEAIDTLEDIEQRLGVPVSAYELIEDHPSAFSVTVVDQAGRGCVLVGPKTVADAALLALCQGSSDEAWRIANHTAKPNARSVRPASCQFGQANKVK